MSPLAAIGYDFASSALAAPEGRGGPLLRAPALLSPRRRTHTAAVCVCVLRNKFIARATRQANFWPLPSYCQAAAKLRPWRVGVRARAIAAAAAAKRTHACTLRATKAIRPPMRGAHAFCTHSHSRAHWPTPAHTSAAVVFESPHKVCVCVCRSHICARCHTHSSGARNFYGARAPLEAPA